MRLVLSIDGSVLVPELRPQQLKAYADVITTLTEAHDICVVTGGGAPAREYIDVGRAVGANDIELDQIGVDVTRLNARLLIAAIGDEAVPTPAREYETANRALRRGDIVVMGGTAPAQTTDAVSAVLAEYVDADRLIYATSTPGVFGADSNTCTDAEPFDELTPSQLVSLILDRDVAAGSSVSIGLHAARMLRRAQCETIVLDGGDPESVRTAVRTGEFEGTRIVPGQERRFSP
ncbi:UMP kinase [Salinigranum halophilum]|uniref:UMP kinase n=1 Tax=Salinigranum halophilum TaxID=2565931 RepID=UPI0010A892BF|nr:UMP kinase [Salinigranum halophilum]